MPKIAFIPKDRQTVVCPPIEIKGRLIQDEATNMIYQIFWTTRRRLWEANRGLPDFWKITKPKVEWTDKTHAVLSYDQAGERIYANFAII